MRIIDGRELPVLTIMEILIYTTHAIFQYNLGNWPQNTVFGSYFSTRYANGNRGNNSNCQIKLQIGQIFVPASYRSNLSM